MSENNVQENELSSERHRIYPEPQAAQDSEGGDEVLSSSRTCLSRGEARLDENDTDGAIDCAYKGLGDLGDSYRPPLVKDDTGLKVLMAEAQIREGQPEAGARNLLKVLKERIGLYERLHKETLGSG
jgi:hypothetical protein